MRIDENNKFRLVKLLDGTIMEGTFQLERGTGSLGYAPQVFIQGCATKFNGIPQREEVLVIPVSSVLYTVSV